MSPDSDAVKWIAFVAALAQTTAAIIQVRQGQKAGESTSPAAAVTGPLKLGLLAAVFSALWVAGFGYMYERHEVGALVYYAERDELQNATFLQVLLFTGDLVIPGLSCAAVVAIIKAIFVGRLDMSQTLAHVVALAASTAGLFVAVAQMYALGSDVLWPTIVIGALAGFQVDIGGPIKRSSGPSS